MATQLIESTSSAPTLRERAIAEFVQAEEQREVEAQESKHRDFARRVDVLRIYLRDHLGLFDSDSVKIGEIGMDVPGGFTATTADGLRFAFKDAPFGGELLVAVTCDRGCGQDLWVKVDSPYMLGAVLEPDATNTHSFACLQKFDDEGEPITDTIGNPLPPRGQPRLTPEQNARASISAIEAAASWVADALNTIALLEDERSLIKPQAIRRLMESGAATSATAAEKIVEQDPEYAAHRAKQRDAEIVKWAAAAQYEAAKLTAKLDVAIATSSMRVSE